MNGLIVKNELEKYLLDASFYNCALQGFRIQVGYVTKKSYAKADI